MLNIFLGRKPLPNYRLVEPAGGELQKIIVKEDVSDSRQDFQKLDVHLLTSYESDDENQATRVWRNSPKCHLR
jgi:hypothetical protein